MLQRQCIRAGLLAALCPFGAIANIYTVAPGGGFE
jgi:hypothetical protein